MAVDLTKVKKAIGLFGWFHFGNKDWACPGPTEELLDEYFKDNKLKPPCDKCYKMVIFFDNEMDDEGFTNFFKYVNKIPKQCWGKINGETAVFYCDSKQELLKFMPKMQSNLDKIGLECRVNWVRACNAYRDKKPELWVDSKTFIPD